MLCHLPCGCCWCFWTSLFGWNNIVGASVPSCCRRDHCGLKVLFSTSTGALVGRIVVVAGIAAFLHRMHEKETEYDECLENSLDDDDLEAKDECNHHLVGKNRYNDDELIFWLTVSLVIASIYTLVSLVGMYYGWTGAEAEAEANQSTAIAGTDEEAASGDFVMSDPHVIVVQSVAVSNSSNADTPSAVAVRRQMPSEAAVNATAIHAIPIQQTIPEKGMEVDI